MDELITNEILRPGNFISTNNINPIGRRTTYKVKSIPKDKKRIRLEGYPELNGQYPLLGYYERIRIDENWLRKFGFRPIDYSKVNTYASNTRNHKGSAKYTTYWYLDGIEMVCNLQNSYTILLPNSKTKVVKYLDELQNYYDDRFKEMLDIKLR